MVGIFLEDDRGTPRNGPYSCSTCIFQGGGIFAQCYLPTRSSLLSWLRRPGRSRPDDRFEDWITQHYQERVLEDGSSPPDSCPDQAFLEELAKRSKGIALDDPRVGHAANCSLCMRRLLEIRLIHRERRQRTILIAAVASCALIVTALVVRARQNPTEQSRTTVINEATQTVDLWNTGTFRGDQPLPLQAVTLPAALVKVTVILPRFSDPGKYVVAVTRDQTGHDLLAKAGGVTATDGAREQVSVLLDLRKSQPGSYFLSTTHEQNQASYYYPLQIK
jgi:hypothetical protein